jgi:hypothetical protein
MLDSPGHKADSGPAHACGTGRDISSRQSGAGSRESGAGSRESGAGSRRGGASARPREAGSRRRDPGVRGARRGRRASASPAAGPPGRWWGTRPGCLGVGLVIGGAAAGLLATLLAGRDPGLVLGIFLLAGTAAGALAARPRAAYLIIPVPALAYVAAAIVAGLVHDRAADTSHTALVISAAQWIASGFLAMSAATLLAIVVAVARWVAARRHGRGQRRQVIR